MKKTILSVLICLALLMASVPASTVQAQALSPEEKLVEQVPEIIRERPHLEPPVIYPDDLPDGWYDPHFEENEKREYIPPTEKSLKLTQEQVQSFDCGTVTDVPRVGCEALVALYESTNGAGWTDNTNWLQTTTVGDWFGITIYGEHVNEIILFENNLTGTIPAILGNLSNLKYLILDFNQLTGTIPVELGNLTNLENLGLSMNQLTGTIPVELGYLTNLKVLGLGMNQLTGTIPTELGSLVNLQSLHLFSNYLTGTIPDELGNLSNLKKFYLFSNKLTGSIPEELGNLSNIQQILLGENQLAGKIPAELGNLSNLKALSLGDNQLTGIIPAELGNLLSLEGLYLSYNQLTHTIPAEIGNLLNLEELSLNNNLLTGTIPAEIGNLTELIWLDLSHNLLESDVPASFINLVNLCVDGQPEDRCYNYYKTDLGYNLLNVPQPNPPSNFLYEKDPDWDQTQGVKGVFPGATGGTLVSNDGRTTVTVPAGAIEGNLTLILKPTLPVSGFTPPFVSAGNDFELLAFDANGEVTQFNLPLTFTLKYSDADVGLMPEESLALHYYDVNAKQWRDAITTCSSASYTRNPEQNQFSLPVCHLTDFAVVGEGFTNYFPALLK
jgi:hypothetical protein